MATFTRKKLAFLQLPDTKGDIYTTPASTTGLIHNIVIHNTDSVIRDVTINYHDGTNEYAIFELQVPALDTVILDFIGEGLLVDAVSKLTGLASAATTVNCLVTGSEETV